MVKTALFKLHFHMDNLKILTFEQGNDKIIKQQILQEYHYQCPHCQKFFKSPQSRKTHWSTNERCQLLHLAMSIEHKQLKKICSGCGKIYTKSTNCFSHMIKCNDVTEKMLQQAKEKISIQKVLPKSNFQILFEMKETKYGIQELRIPEFIYETRYAFINKKLIKYFENQLLQGKDIPIKGDIRNDYLWENISKLLLSTTGSLCEVLVFDPAWKTRFDQGYKSLNNRIIEDIPLNLIQENGLIFYWVLPGTYKVGERVLQEFGYKRLKDLTWIKLTSKGNYINSIRPEYSVEICLVGYKGNVSQEILVDVPEVIYSVVRGNSEKPEDLWDWIQSKYPNAVKLEGFARTNLGRKYTIHVGNEVVADESMRIV